MAEVRGDGRVGRAHASAVTVLVAGAANLAVGLAKAVAGLVSGSAAMLAEAAHSVADTVTQVLLLTAVRRGARPADRRHPFGYGRERYLWALLAAVSTFVVGAGFSIARGVDTIRAQDPPGRFAASYAVLAVASVVEGVSLTRALRQVRREAGHRRTPPLRYLRLTADTDGLASLAIGALLVAVAATLAQANMSLLVGRSVPEPMREAIHRELGSLPAVDAVPTLLTMLLGPSEVLVAAKIDFADDATGADIKAAADEAERRLGALLPGVLHLFLDPTRSGGRLGE